MAKYYGIDLGTTYSCIAIIDDSTDKPTPQVVTDTKTQQMVTPSVVHINKEGQVIVGQPAKSYLGSDAENTVAFIKREMSNPNYKREIRGKEYTPEEISSMILKHLVDKANTQRMAADKDAQPIYDVFITHPAYFAELETRRTRKAGELAGLNVIGMVNEPTAAALSYGQGQSDDKTLLIYDLGGGTFDVTIMEFKNHVANVLSTDGDPKLGGYDWDRALVDFVLEKFNGNFEDLSLSDKNKLLKIAEDVKKQLSAVDEYTMEFTYKGMQEVLVTREDFDNATSKLLYKTQGLTHRALEKAKLKTENIDEVILIGGSTHMPQIQQFVKGMFPNIKVEQVEPELAVAKGAAICAYHEKRCGIKKDDGVWPGVDRNPYAYGICAYDSNDELRIYNLIKSNDEMEKEVTTEEGEFVTYKDGQTCVRTNVYQSRSQQDSMLVSDGIGTELFAKGNENNAHPEKQEVSWGTPAPKGTSILYRITRNKSGDVKVYVECNGAKGEFEIGMPDTSNSTSISRG
ncbi:MAG: Hsp70 family protein [Bacteroidales bacterium]|nr:Hsp70 family protein [Bacteroidales bacterium]